MIRELVQSDIPDVNKIHNYYVFVGTESLDTETLTDEQMLSRAMWIALDNPYYVAPRDKAVVGFCYAHPWKERSAYSNTYEVSTFVSPDYLREGIGSSLMEHIISDCRQRGCRALVASITAGNEAAIRFHEKFGFKEASHFREVARKAGQWLDVVDYELLL